MTNISFRLLVKNDKIAISDLKKMKNAERQMYKLIIANL